MESNSCAECAKTFSNRTNLRKHALKFHPTKSHELAPYKNCGKVYKFHCDRCSKKFNHANNFAFHKRKFHDLLPKRQTKSAEYICPLCSKKVAKDEFERHMENLHDLPLIKENIEFPSYDCFIKWKNDLEQKEYSNFVKYSGLKRTLSLEKQNFHCHRSGHFQSKGKGMRQVKIQGSKKINSYCPASIKLTVDSATGACKVVYLKTHVGHRNELCHLTIPKEHREALAAKIAQKIPFGEILNEVRDSVSNEKLERLHFLTRKDLHNIVGSFNVNSDSCRHANDAISIDTWVTEMKDASSVQFYKPQNSLSEQYPSLTNEDFMLIIMNETQSEILKKFGPDCICIDRTHGMDSYVFEIVTLMVIDEMQQGFPCAFLICNRTDQEVISIFYEHIKKYIGSLKPNVFMSDMADSFYNAWLAVMELPAKRVYCRWHVDHAWREQLSKVKSKDTQIEVYRMLRTLLEERDMSTFEIIFNEALSVLMEDSHTREFGYYFRDNYSKNTRNWAYCFYLHADVNTNIHLERIHKTIKYIYVQGHNVKRLDKCLHILMEFLKDRLSDRLIMLHKAKITNKVKILRQKHMASLKLDPDKVIEDQNGWLVASTINDTEMYSVQENIIGCTCNIVCKDCDTCIHRYICTCGDNSIKWNMCKHIHLICMKRNRAPEHVIPEAVDNNISLDADDRELQIVDMADDDLQEQVAQLSKKQILDEKFTERKQEFINRMKTLIDYFSCEEELDILEKCVAPVKATVDALRMSKETEVNSQLSDSVQPANETVSHQIRLHLTKKKKVLKIYQNCKTRRKKSKKIALSSIVNRKKKMFYVFIG